MLGLSAAAAQIWFGNMKALARLTGLGFGTFQQLMLEANTDSSQFKPENVKKLVSFGVGIVLCGSVDNGHFDDLAIELAKKPTARNESTMPLKRQVRRRRTAPCVSLSTIASVVATA